MRFARMLALVAAVAAGPACGSTQGGNATAGSPATAPADPPYAATQWIPARPTYAFASRSVREAQRSARDLLDGVGAPFGVTAPQLAGELVAFLGVDLFSEVAVGNVGVDLDSSVAVFSDGANPTLVVKLADPERLQQFLEERRARGLNTQSVVVDGVEVYTAKFQRSTVSWAIADRWFYLHFGLPFGKDDSATWFATTRTQDRAPRPWAATWEWARGTAGEAADSIVGFVDPAALVASFKRVDEARACLDLVPSVSRVALGIEGDGRTMRTRVAFEVGAGAATLAAATKRVPAGWSSMAAAAPLAVELNVDLGAAAGWVGPCLRAAGVDPGIFAQYGITSGRAILLDLDADQLMSSRGVVTVDLAHKRHLASLLDQIPMRSMAEKRRRFGNLAGHRLSIPFGPSVDYILTDTFGAAAAGDGVLERVVGSGPPVPSAVARLDLRFDAMSPASWAALLDLVDAGLGARVTPGLAAWQEAHASLSLEGTSLVLDASATRH